MLNNPIISKLNFLVGSDSIFDAKPAVPFNTSTLHFFEQLSNLILNSVKAKEYPDLITFAFYCRTANIKKMRKIFTKIDNNRLGWGLALHIAPSNVPMNFAYSLFFGMLSGNANLVRLPSNNYPQITIFCDAVNALFNLKEHHTIASSNAIVQFDRNSDFLVNHAQLFDLRIIWGGDETIENMRSYSWSASSKEIAFFNRSSIAVINPRAINQLTNEKMIQLCQQLFNDTYIADQNACSSPVLIYWHGDELELSKAQERLWSVFSSFIKKKYQLDTVKYINKLIQLLKALDNEQCRMKFTQYSQALWTANLEDLAYFASSPKAAFGFFFEYQSSSLDPLFKIISRQHQTLTYFGCDRKVLVDGIISNQLTGIDRIVPIGQALQMDAIWDGMSLPNILSREISVI